MGVVVSETLKDAAIGYADFTLEEVEHLKNR
jgi:hypothetical protein